MTNPLIVTVPILPFGMVHSHAIVGPTSCILADTGTPGSEHKIERALRKQGRGFKDVSLIVTPTRTPTMPARRRGCVS